MIVTLNKEQCDEADLIAHAKYNYSMTHGHKPFNQDPKDSLREMIQGMRAERAACLWIGAPFIATENDIGRPDIPPNIEIRSTTYRTGRIPIKDKDNDRSPFLLIHIYSPTVFKMVGWAYAFEAKKPEYLEKHRGEPCYFYPKRHHLGIISDSGFPFLRPIESLKKFYEAFLTR